jgi:hypothetical protein
MLMLRFTYRDGFKMIILLSLLMRLDIVIDCFVFIDS